MRHEHEAVRSSEPVAPNKSEHSEEPNKQRPDSTSTIAAGRTTPELEKEVDHGPPKLQEGSLGLQQLIMEGKPAKENSMKMLYSVAPKAIIAWRILRKQYLRWVRGYNASHAVKLTVRPVRDFVDPTLWAAVSRKKLLPHHRTGKNEDPNHVECANYFCGTAEYKGLITKETSDATKFSNL